MFSRRSLALVVAAILGGAVLLGGVALATGPVANHGGVAGILESLVKSGVITADQKTKIVEAFRAARADHRRPGWPGLKAGREEIAKAIGITVEQLRQEWPGKSLVQVAQAHGVSREQLLQRLTAAATERIDKALAEKKITAEQAANLKARLPEFLARFVDRVHDRKPGQAHPTARKFLGNLVEEAAGAIGISAGQLKQELPGKSLAQVAQAHGVSRDTLVQRLTVVATQRIDKALAEKKLTAEQAANMKSHLPDALARSVDHVFGNRTPSTKP